MAEVKDGIVTCSSPDELTDEQQKVICNRFVELVMKAMGYEKNDKDNKPA